jgi:hypothetical protein
MSDESMHHSMYHRVLRVSALVCACVLLFESGLVIESTRQLSLDTHSYLASVVGMSASVEPTELNTLTSELTEQKLALDAREAAIREREIEVGLAPGQATGNERMIYILSGILFVLLVLIILNYALDYLRYRERTQPFISRPV